MVKAGPRTEDRTRQKRPTLNVQLSTLNYSERELKWVEHGAAVPREFFFEVVEELRWENGKAKAGVGLPDRLCDLFRVIVRDYGATSGSA